jgi:RHS repeat-associated protein
MHSVSLKFLVGILSFSDYYPFGMQMVGRNASTGDYRYGFQGQETDDEVTGSESHVSYKYRMHDARLGRFLSLDPLAPEYAHNSPYAFSENRVIDAVELEGREARIVVTKINKREKATAIKIVVDVQVLQSANLSATPAQQTQYLADIKTQFESSYGGEVRVGLFRRKVKIEVEVNYEQGNASDPFTLRLQEDLGLEHVGITEKIGDTQNNYVQVQSGPDRNPRKQAQTQERSRAQIGSTGAHELGHTLGLRHRLNLFARNLMSRNESPNRSSQGQSRLRRNQKRRAVRQVLKDTNRGKLRKL